MPDPAGLSAGELNPPFNAATVAMLVLIAGMTPVDQRDFRVAYFADPEYSWRSGRSPFRGRLFSTPEHVFHYCLDYRRRDLAQRQGH